MSESPRPGEPPEAGWAHVKTGTLAHTVRQPVDVLIDLDFGTAVQAENFLDLLRTRVWAVRDKSPALAGAPITRLLEVRVT